jgi:hypothetical protein
MAEFFSGYVVMDDIKADIKLSVFEADGIGLGYLRWTSFLDDYDELLDILTQDFLSSSINTDSCHPQSIGAFVNSEDPEPNLV